MIAVGFASVGLALEIATTAFPSSFIVLAGLGNFSKALGKGLSQPSFRIIQTHFALANNVGDISAKEEVTNLESRKCCLQAQALALPCLPFAAPDTSLLAPLFPRRLH